MSILTFTEYQQPKQTPAGKWTPSKGKATDGKTYALAKSTVALIENSLGTPLDCEVTSEPNGRWVNYSVLSARHIAAAAAGPESPNPHINETAMRVHAIEKSTSQEGQSATPAAPSWQSADEKKQRLIVRQSCIARAIEVLGPGKTPADYAEWTDYFTNLVFEEQEESGGLNGGGGDNPGRRIPATNIPAEKSAPRAIQQLVEVRQKTTDIRAGYANEDAVCPNCGRKEFLGRGTSGWFCSTKSGGCGHPPRGERLDAPITYGEWKQRAVPSNLRRPDAPVVGPMTHPTTTTSGAR